MHRLLSAVLYCGWPEGHHAFRLRGNCAGHRTRIAYFGSIGPILIGCDHDEVGG